MDVGIGLPATVPGVTRGELLEWARRAEAAGFSSLGTIDRLVYPNLEPMMALSAAAAVTERVRLTTDILLLPLRVNAALVAKQAASLQKLSEGRLVLGVAVGAREDDYAASGVPFSERGRRLEAMVDEMQAVWRGERGIGPELDHPPELLVGGGADVVFRRAARFGDGWTMGGGPPEVFREALQKLHSAWEEEGRGGEPRAVALAYYALGDGAQEQAERYAHHYYEYLGDLAGQIAAGTSTDADAVKASVQAFADAGADELIFFPCSTDPEQVDLLAGAAL
jgi:alkanesulfonate monooxygenase SsuD/methylene tetrahydromethanopterin reductase-like flavin-dependent oxidoreductase (luciferase family)